ncbi:M56 family metallopeptidase [uncultured Aquimarina sp.]|uniref:M56 family metallopeptidase n=1 Tax=uncultured Aquimarina sp. TaxID=575652 RepID=UPI002609C5AB|nr:M56 family metallopeptidase [uncultured Aquimarina sp.]
MEFFIPYLLKSSAILALFYLIHFFFLRKDTFFNLNRHFFLVGIICSIFLPFITIKTTTEIETPMQQEVYHTKSQAFSNTPLFSSELPLEMPTTEKKWNWTYIIIVFYTMGVILFLSWILWQLFTIKSLINKGINTKKKGYKQIHIEDKIAPFSFNKSIVINPSLHSDYELDMIIKHEEVHVYQRHTYDIISITILCAFQWINPFIWMYKKALQQNLEYIADRETISKTESAKNYQLALINVSLNQPISITNNFYQSFIKKRILMLNIDQSNKWKQLKIFIILPLLSLFIWSFNIKEEIKYITTTISLEKEIPSTNLDSLEKNEKEPLLIKQNKENTIPVLKTPKSKQILKKPNLTNKKEAEKEKFSTKNIPNRIDKFRISNTASKKEIIALKKKLKKEFKTDLIINTLEHYDGFISKINLTFEDEFGNTGGIADEDNDSPIQHLVLVRETNNQGGVKIFKFHTEYIQFGYENNKRRSKEINDIYELGREPSYMINDTIYKKSDLIGKSFITNIGLEIIPQYDAYKKYGEIATDGLIIIKNALPFPNEELFIKKFQDILGKKDINMTAIEISKKKLPKLSSITYYKGDSYLITANNYKFNKLLKKHGLSNIKGNPEKDPIIIIDNIAITYRELRQKDFDTFKDITKLTPKESVTKYGDFGENGAVIITTK